MSVSDTNGPAGIAESVRSLAVRFGEYLVPLFFLLAIWQGVTAARLIPEQTLPQPIVVGEAIASNGFFLEAAGLTVMRVIFAFLIAVSLGIVVGLMMSQFVVVEWFMDPIISVAFPIPKVTLVPVFVLWFGFGTTGVVALAATSAFFPAVIGTYNGAKSVQRELIWSARSMGLSRANTSVRVVFPAALPDVLNGAQISLFLSFAVVVVAEMVTAGSGLGRVLVESTRFFNTAEAIGAVVVIALFGLVITRLFDIVRGRLLWWTE